jgi:hypothetical protein
MDRICGHGESLARGKYLLLNNLWGAAGGRGSQCLSSEGDVVGEGVAWSTSWEWQGDADTVKSYAAAVLGWHWGWALAGSGLPVPLSRLAVAESDWDYRLTSKEPGRLNVAYDIWLAATPDPGMEDLTDEIMIWLHRDGGATPIGTRQGRVRVDGADWELWEGPHPDRGWAVHSFVRVASTTSAALNLKNFFDHLAPRMRDAVYLVGIQAGTEVFTGSGTLETSRYSVELAGG